MEYFFSDGLFTSESWVFIIFVHLGRNFSFITMATARSNSCSNFVFYMELTASEAILLPVSVTKQFCPLLVVRFRDWVSKCNYSACRSNRYLDVIFFSFFFFLLVKNEVRWFIQKHLLYWKKLVKNICDHNISFLLTGLIIASKRGKKKKVFIYNKSIPIVERNHRYSD